MNIDFLQLYEKIYSVLPSGSLQDLMDVCYEVTRTPILIVDITYNVLGIAPATPTGDYLWDYLLEHHGYETDKVALMLEDGIIQSVDQNKAPYVIDWGSQEGHPKIQGIVRINNTVEAYVTMNCTGSEVTPDKLKAMEIIQTICGYFYKGNETEGNMFHTYQKVFMTELMNDRIQTEEQLDRWFEDMDMQIDAPFAVTAISAPEEKGRLLLSLIRKSCQSLPVRQLMLIQNNILYTLYFGSSVLQNQSYLHALTDILKRFDGHCGISREFSDLLNFSIYRRQASHALSIGLDLHIQGTYYQYKDYPLQSILLPRVKKMAKADYIPPVLEEIKQYDDKNSTEFLLTLRTWLHYLQNTSDTAAALHIHRNTLMYRLNKIEELFDLSLKDYETCLQFMNTFYMLELDKELKKSR